MAHFLNNKCCKLVCISAIALTSLSSCMKDDITGCPTAKLSLKFDYTYNVKEADAFSAEVKNLNVYVFDKNGKFVDNYTESADKFETGHKMEITDLQEEMGKKKRRRIRKRQALHRTLYRTGLPQL